VDLLDGFGDVDEDLVDGFVDEEDSTDLGGEDGELILASGAGSGSDSMFDAAIMELEQIMMEPAFNERVGAFMAANCNEFDDTEENKLIYTSIFEQYVEMLETYIEAELAERMPDFDMASFCTTLMERGPAKLAEELDLEMLGAFGDFEAFRQLMLAEKHGMECDAGDGGPLCLVGASLTMHVEEQEDGIEIPDLNLSITSATSPVKR